MITLPKLRFDRRTFVIAILFCAGLFPIVLMLYHVRANWVPLPMWDEWHTPGKQFESWCRGTLTFGELFSQHNESRKFFPRLLYFGLASVGGWDVRKEMTVLFLEVCLLSALLWRVLRQTPGSTSLSAVSAWAAMTFLCFSPVQFENFLYGIQLETFFPGVATVAIAIVNLSALSFRAKTLTNLSLAFVATYTCANGMLLWLLGVPLPDSCGHGARSPWKDVPRQSEAATTAAASQRRWYLVYLLSASIAIGCYFIGYKKPSYHPEFASIRDAVDLVHYFILWIGGYFTSDYVNPFIFGIAAFALFLAVNVLGLILLVRNKAWRTFYPWLLIGAYSLITGIITAFGRLGMGVEQALGRRYTVFSLFFYLALTGVVFAIYCVSVQAGSAAARARFLSNSAWVVSLASICWVGCYKTALPQLRSAYNKRVKLLRALEWINPIPDNPDLSLIFPYLDVLGERVRILAEHGIWRRPLISGPLAMQLQQAPPYANGSNGQIETCEIARDHSLLVTGWAWLPARNHRANCVVIGCRDMTGRFKPMAVLETGMRRQDLRERFQNPNIYHAGFSRKISQANVLSDAVTIEGWAIDLKEQKAFPLASLASLPPSTL